MMEINRLIIRIVNGKIQENRVAMMENWCGIFGHINELEMRFQAVGGLEMPSHMAIEFHISDSLSLKQIAFHAQNQDCLPNPVFVELPEVELRHAIVVAA